MSTPTMLSARSAVSKQVLLPLWIFHVPITSSLLAGLGSAGFIVVGKSCPLVGTVCAVVLILELESLSAAILLLLPLLILISIFWIPDTNNTSVVSADTPVTSVGNSQLPLVEFNVTTRSLTRSTFCCCGPFPLRGSLIIIEPSAAISLLRLVMLILIISLLLLPPSHLPLILIFLESAAIFLPRPDVRELLFSALGMTSAWPFTVVVVVILCSHSFYLCNIISLCLIHTLVWTWSRYTLTMIFK